MKQYCQRIWKCNWNYIDSKEITKTKWPNIFFFILSNVKVSIKCQQRFYLVYYQSLNIKYHVDNEQVKSQLNKCCVWLVSFCDTDFIFLLFQWLSLGVLCQTPATEGRERAHPSWRGCGSSCQEVSVIIAKTCSY